MINLEGMFIGKIIAAVDLSFSREVGGTCISSITFTDGSTIHLNGEHDCAYLDGWSQDGKRIVEADVAENQTDPDPEPHPEDEPKVTPRLRDMLASHHVSWFERAPEATRKLLDYPAAPMDGWPVEGLEKKYVRRALVVTLPEQDPESPNYDWREAQTTGRKIAVGDVRFPWEDARIIFATIRDGMTNWIVPAKSKLRPDGVLE